MKLTIPALLALITSAVALPTDTPLGVLRREQGCEACRDSCETASQANIASFGVCVVVNCGMKVRYLPITPMDCTSACGTDFLF
jgi:hypothetical protein